MSSKQTNDVTVALVGESANFSTGKIAALGHSRYGSKKSGRYPLEIKKGQQYGADGRLVDKEQIIDRLNDRYFEEVVEVSTGIVLRSTEERLSQHINRGTAKTKMRDA